METLISKLGSEVRQSMHNMIGLIELAAGEPLSERRAQYLSRAREGADRLVHRVGDLGELGRPSTIVNAAPFAIREALAEIADLMGALAGLKGLTFDWLVDPDVPACITADRFMIQDIAHRLIGNAIRFTRAGGARLLATATQTSDRTPALVLEVTDSGPGIPRDVLAALESPEGDAGSSGLDVGGLGLLVVQKRMADVGGRMSISSNPEGGTTVRVSLPVGVAEGRVAPAPAKSGLEPRRLKLLIAEDSDDSFLLFQAYTEEAGHGVIRAHDGVEAVEMAKEEAYDLIVMDASMPGLDGYTATRLIREWETAEGRARRPIVMLSADDLERQRRMGGAVGCSGYLSKPANREQLLHALAYYAGGDRAAARLPRPNEGQTLLV